MILKGKINLGCLKAEEEIEVISTEEEQVITPANPNNTFNKITVKPIIEKKIEENKTVKSTDEQQIIKPSEGYDAIGKITVKPVPLGTTQIRPSAKMDILEKPPAGVDGFVSVLVERVEADIDENITEENIREGITILGVEGKLHESIMEEEKTVKSTEEEQTISPAEGYDGIKGIKVLPIVLEGKSQRASKDEDITITPSEGYDGIGEVVIPKIRLKSKTATPSTSEQTIKLNTLEAMSNDALSEVVIAPVDAGIDENIIPENIAEGVSILGVEGTHSGGGEDTLAMRLNNTLESYTIPEGATRLPTYLFKGCTNLKELKNYKKSGFTFESYSMAETSIEELDLACGNGAQRTTLENYAFNKCNSLKTVSFEGSSFYTFNNYVFADSSVEEVLSIPFIGSYMFQNCKKLKTITFAEGISVIGTISSNACRNCTALEAVELPDYISSISTYGFGGCSSLKSVKINNSGCSMQSNSFTGCSAITNFQVAEGHNKAIYISEMTALTHDSLVALINNLGTVSSLALTIGSTNKAKLSEEEIAVATNKGWVVS